MLCGYMCWCWWRWWSMLVVLMLWLWLLLMLFCSMEFASNFPIGCVCMLNLFSESTFINLLLCALPGKLFSEKEEDFLNPMLLTLLLLPLARSERRGEVGEEEKDGERERVVGVGTDESVELARLLF